MTPPACTLRGCWCIRKLGEAVDEEMTFQGHRMSFRTVDLMGDPGEFEISLRGLVGDHG